MIDKIIVTITGLVAIVFTYWFFLMKKETVVNATKSIDIVVDGGYNPETIAIKKGKTITLNFLRKDPSPCLEDVVLPDFKIRRTLPLNKNVSIEITPQKTGTFTISCGMNMFHGKIIVQ
jgi:plastocyanin domain-containing protein